MMSSWRSGRTTSLTAWWKTGAISSAPSAATEAKPRRAAIRRLRTWRRWAAVRRAIAPTSSRGSGSCGSDDPIQDVPELALQLLDRSVVDDGVGRPLLLLLLGELARVALVEVRVAARGGPLVAHLVGRDDRDRRVVHPLEVRLEQQWRLHHQRARICALFAEGDNPGAHAGPDLPLQP